MSKNLKRYKRRLIREEHNRLINVERKDLHHIFYQRKNWKGDSIGALRDFYYCKAYIPKDTLHGIIHAEIPTVPVPKPENAAKVLRQLITLEEYSAIGNEDSISKRLRVLIALFDCIEQPTADALKSQLDIVCKFRKEPP